MLLSLVPALVPAVSPAPLGASGWMLADLSPATGDQAGRLTPRDVGTGPMGGAGAPPIILEDVPYAIPEAPARALQLVASLSRISLANTNTSTSQIFAAAAIGIWTTLFSRFTLMRPSWLAPTPPP